MRVREGRRWPWALKTMGRLRFFLQDVKLWRVEKRDNLRGLRHKGLLWPGVEGGTRTRTGRPVRRLCNYSSPRWQGVGDQGDDPWLGSGSNFNSRAECSREFKMRLAIKSCVFLWAQASIRYRGKCNSGWRLSQQEQRLNSGSKEQQIPLRDSSSRVRADYPVSCVCCL